MNRLQSNFGSSGFLECPDRSLNRFFPAALSFGKKIRERKFSFPALGLLSVAPLSEGNEDLYKVLQAVCSFLELPDRILNLDVHFVLGSIIHSTPPGSQSPYIDLRHRSNALMCVEIARMIWFANSFSILPDFSSVATSSASRNIWRESAIFSSSESALMFNSA
jgi:hypothetical protein